MKNLNVSLRFLLGLMVVILFTTCAVNPVTGKKELMLMSREQEKAMGLQADPGIVANYGLYEDPELQKFVDGLGEQMAAISHLPNLKFNFRILDSPVVNAFALPGGYIYFTRGILAHFNNEAQFAGVLGHEIGHVTARHSASQYSKQMLAQVGLVAGVALSEDFRQYAGVAQQGLGLLFLKFGRDDEMQSDKLGVEYSTRIGYDAHHMADFFKTLDRLSGDSGQSLPTFLSTHPDPGDRYENVKKMASQWQQKTGIMGLHVNRERYLRMIDGIVYGDDPRQGYVENSVFYHPELKFQFPIPRSWQTINTPQQVQMAPQDGKAALILTLANQQNLDAAAQAFVEQTGVTPTDSRQTSVNGNNALVLEAQLQDQQSGQVIRLVSYFIEYGGLIYQFMGLSAAADFSSYSNTFRQTMTSFDRLTDQSKIDVEPKRIRIKEVQTRTDLSNALTSLGAKRNQLEELSILNGIELQEMVDKGTLLKVIE